MKNRIHPDNRIVEISQNTRKSPEVLRRLATIHSVKDFQPMLVGKAHGGCKIMKTIIIMIIITCLGEEDDPLGIMQEI